MKKFWQEVSRRRGKKFVSPIIDGQSDNNKILDVFKDNEHWSSQPPNKESKTDVLGRSSSKSKKGKSLDNTPDMKTLNKSIIIGGKHVSKLPDSKCKSGSLTTKGPLEKHSKSWLLDKNWFALSTYLK